MHQLVNYQDYRILLVDDSGPMLNLLQLYLEQSGFIVKSTTSAEQAIKMVEREEVDLLISDIFMPQMTGFELSRKLKNKIPVILITAGESDELQENIADLSDAFLHKAIGREQLVQAVKKTIDRWKMTDDLQKIKR